jgi:hypothetical protein
MITMRPLLGGWPAFMPRKPKLRAIDEAVIFPALLVVVVLIGIPLMMLIEICRNPRRRYPVSTRKG